MQFLFWGLHYRTISHSIKYIIYIYFFLHKCMHSLVGLLCFNAASTWTCEWWIAMLGAGGVWLDPWKGHVRVASMALSHASRSTASTIEGATRGLAKGLEWCLQDCDLVVFRYFMFYDNNAVRFDKIWCLTYQPNTLRIRRTSLWPFQARKKDNFAV